MLHPALKRLSITVFAAFAVTGAAALLFCLRCIPAEIREFRDIGKDSLDQGLGALAALLGRPVIIFIILFLVFIIVLLVFEAKTLWKKLRSALKEETYTLYWNYTVSELSAILVNGVLFFAVSPLSNKFVNATDARINREFLLCFAVLFFSAICAVIALIISYRGKRYE